MARFPESIHERNERLEEARQTLKEEFIGIDDVIDKVIDSLGSWYLYPNIQERPYVVNLWGMTGVGKSALLKRVRDLLSLNDRFFRFDLGKERWSMLEQLEKIHDLGEGEPLVLALDEFQHARTIDELGKEKENGGLRVLWELLDNGTFNIIKHQKELERLLSFKTTFRYLREQGLVVRNGLVVEGQELFRNYLPQYGGGFKPLHLKKQSDETPFILSEGQLEDIMDLSDTEYSSILEVEQEVSELDERELEDFLEEVLRQGRRPKTVDCCQALIFVVGNLDEAYWMRPDHDPEAGADKLHELSKGISIPEVKSALSERFRSEQVARLGNNHILYPAFSRRTFEKLIDQDLYRISQKVYEQEGLEMLFDRSVHELIYQEGVFPSQGTRPVYTTIQQMVDMRLGAMMAHYHLLENPVDQLYLAAEEKSLRVEFRQEGRKMDEKRFPVHRELGKLRANKKDDRQALCAAHEAGHATLGILLLERFPEEVITLSVKDQKNGYTRFAEPEGGCITKKELEHKGVVLLGGSVAEELLFGEEDLTVGSEDDHQKATEMALRMQKEWGMGPEPGYYYPNGHVEPQNLFRDRDGNLEQRSKDRVREWKEKARRMLREHWGLFMTLADSGSEERRLNKEDIQALVEQVEPALAEAVRNSKGPRFRERLKEEKKRAHRSFPPLIENGKGNEADLEGQLSENSKG